MGAEKIRREEMIRKAEKRRLNQERSPIEIERFKKKKDSTPPPQKKRPRSDEKRPRSDVKGRPRRSLSRSLSGRRMGQRSRARTRSRDKKAGSSSISRMRRKPADRNPGDRRRSESRRRTNRSKSELKRPVLKLNKKKRKRRRRDRERDRARRKGGLGLRDLKSMKEENEEMQAKLADKIKRKDGGVEGVGSSVQDRLAMLAGIGGMRPERDEKRGGSSDSSGSETDGYDSESETESVKETKTVSVKSKLR